MKTRNLITLGVLAGLCVLSAGAGAVAIPSDDAKILIDRALNSPTLTVRYSGVDATMVELRVNGTSFGSRQVESKNKRGETTFALDLSSLADGDNDIEVRLFDKDGRLLGTQKSVVTANDGEKGPVYMMSPKVGATVMGPVEIKVGFGKDLKNTYVSFFVNGQFKSMTNTPPFSFVWDTSREVNGWHEIEAWVVDDSTNTFKTRKVRVFVNNPGGPTTRPVPPPATPVAPANPNPAAGTAKGTKPAPTNAAPVESANTTAPAVGSVPAQNPVNPGVSPAASLKTVDQGAAISMGPRALTPGITKAGVKAATVAKAAPSVMEIKVSTPPVTHVPKGLSSAGTISIGTGTRLPNFGAYSISFNSSPVVFDVPPRVQDGIALTPFRALFEQAGGKVDWENISKALTASGMGREVYIKIGDKMARVNKIDVSMELAPFIERGRTMVPLSFIKEGLDVDVQYDQATGHVLITSKKGN